MSLHVHFNEDGHVVVKSVVGDDVVASLLIEESGDAAKKVVHVSVEHTQQGSVQVHA